MNSQIKDSVVTETAVRTQRARSAQGLCAVCESVLRSSYEYELLVRAQSLYRYSGYVQRVPGTIINNTIFDYNTCQVLVNNPLAVFKIRITGTAVVQHNPYLWAAKPVRIKIEKVEKKKEFVRFGLNPTTYYWISGYYCDKGIEYPYTDIGQRSYRTNVTFRVRV